MSEAKAFSDEELQYYYRCTFFSGGAVDRFLATIDVLRAENKRLRQVLFDIRIRLACDSDSVDEVIETIAQSLSSNKEEEADGE